MAPLIINPHRFVEGIPDPVLDDFSCYASQGAADAVYPTNSTTNFRVDIGNDNIKTNFVNNTDDVIYRDLGSVSDSAFVLQFKWNITSYTAYSSGNSAQHGSFALSSGNGDMYEVNDGLGLYFNSNGSTTKAAYTDGANWVSPTMPGSNILTPSVTTKWVRMTRESETSFKVEMFLDEFETLLSSSTITIPASVTGLRYFSILSDSAPISGTGDLRSTIDDFAFYGGVTSLETDPADGFPYGVDLSTSSNATTTGTSVTLDTTCEKITGSVTTNNDRVTVALPLTLSDTEFLLRFKFEIVTYTTLSGNGGTFYLGVTDQDNSTTVLGARDGLGMWASKGGSGRQFALAYPSGGNWGNTYSTISMHIGGGTSADGPQQQAYYVEVARTSSTSVTVTLYSDVNYTTSIHTLTQAIPSTLNGLLYFHAGTWDNGMPNTYTAEVSNIKIWDGISSLS